MAQGLIHPTSIFIADQASYSTKIIIVPVIIPHGFALGSVVTMTSTRSGGPSALFGPSARTVIWVEGMASAINRLRAASARDKDRRRGVDGSSGTPEAKAVIVKFPLGELRAK